jgi:signal transduction histidine kinase
MQVQDEQSQDEIIRALQRQVDELTTANMLLQEQLAQREQFAAMIAHELRGPLTPIISYAQMIARPNQRRETIQRGTSIIISQARRLARLISDLLDSAHVSTGQFTLIREMCDVVALAKEVIEQLRPLAPYHTLVTDVPDTPIMGNWDAGRLQQALGNLLDNAIKYSADATTITVHIWQTINAAHISVHNQGTSIPSADISHLFRPYARLQATSARSGSGLGLYITKCIIEAHGGTLRLEPHTEESGIEQGTTFTFDLPINNATHL